MIDVPLTYQEAEARLRQMAGAAFGERLEPAVLAAAIARNDSAAPQRAKPGKRAARRKARHRRLSEQSFQRLEARYRHLVEGISPSAERWSKRSKHARPNWPLPTAARTSFSPCSATSCEIHWRAS